jgi:hypothetical protein
MHHAYTKRLNWFHRSYSVSSFFDPLSPLETWAFSPTGSEAPGALWIKLALGFLSASFVAASLLAFRYTNAALRAFYRAAAVWMGLVSFVFLAAVSSWIIFGVARLAGLSMNFQRNRSCAD